MKVSLLTIGRLKRGPEKDLFDRYEKRVLTTGKAQGVHPFVVHEYSESRASRANDRMAQEATDLLKQITDQTYVIVLDERGKSQSSERFADLIGQKRDQGLRDLCFVIGGADGLDPLIRDRANMIMSFGQMTWPHQLVRVLVVEQIYRTICLLGGHPYHRS